MTLTRRWALWALACAALAGSAMLAGCSGAARPKPAQLPAGLSNPLRQAWSAKLPGPVDYPLQVHVEGNQVTVAATNGAIVTFDATTGHEIGRAQVKGRLTAGVGRDGKTMAVVTQDNQLVAIDGAHPIWHQRLSTQSYTAPLVAGGRVFVLGADRSLFAFDGAGGALLWHTQPPESDPLVLLQGGVLLPVGNTLVAGLAGRLTGVDPGQGAVQWEAPIAVARGTNDVERLVDLVGGVVRAGNELCIRAFQTAVGCADATDGKVLWTHSASGGTGLAGDDKTLYGAEADGRVLAWQRANGERVWINDALQWRYLSGPQVFGAWVAVGDEKGSVLLLARADGHLVGRAATDGSAIAVQPVVAADTLIVVTRAGGVYGFRRS
ncbi:MAG: outer membrane protein assembly factor BamB [Burkholderiaceae bacterium]|nr:outer membrane protein assembly factor BamB [Burkholderiaceae bacterium]